MSEPRPLGDVLDALGLKATVRDGDLVSSAVLVMSVIEPDGRERVSVAWTDGQSFIARRGLLELARDGERLTREETS